MGNHPLRLSQAAPATPQWPSFKGTSTFVGTSPSGKVNVWYDASLGAPALANAQALVAQADAIVAFDDATFGVQGGPVNVILFALGGATDGTGGADHMGCDFQTGGNIEVCVAFGNNARVYALFEAERSEDQMRGNLCGLSTGESLSRWCSMLAPGSNNALADFTSVGSWAQAGFPNWVDTTQPTDQAYPSIGCGMAFLSWLMAGGADGKKYTLAQVAQAMVSLGDSGTLTGLEQRLTKNGGSPWTLFLAAVKALPASALGTDDPFGAMGGGTPPPPPPPPSTVSTLFTLTVNSPIRSGARVTFRAPVSIPAGTYAWDTVSAKQLIGALHTEAECACPESTLQVTSHPVLCVALKAELAAAQAAGKTVLVILLQELASYMGC